VIHQLTQAGRTLVGFLLICQSNVLRPLIAPALDSLRSCVGLLRRFSSRYLCGQRSCDMMEEFCRLTQIPLDDQTIPQELTASSGRPPWIRPARKKNASASRSMGGVGPPPQGTPEFVGSPVPTAPVNTPFGLAGNFSPVAPTQSPRGFSIGTDASRGRFLDPSRSGADRLDLPKPDPGVGTVHMPSIELMALFGDGGLDVAGLFPQPGMPDFTAGLSDEMSYRHGLLRRGSRGSNEIAEVVGCP